LTIGIDRSAHRLRLKHLFDYFGLTVEKIVPQSLLNWLLKQEFITWRRRLQSTVSDASGAMSARAILERTDHDLELVSINDLADAKANALLFKRDSVHGAFSGTVEVDGNDLIINGKRITSPPSAIRPTCRTPPNGIDIALECTGFFTDRAAGLAKSTSMPAPSAC
jgi:hypothetical protein